MKKERDIGQEVEHEHIVEENELNVRAEYKVHDVDGCTI